MDRIVAVKISQDGKVISNYTSETVSPTDRKVKKEILENGMIVESYYVNN